MKAEPGAAALRPQAEDQRAGRALGITAGISLQATCRTPWQLGTREAPAAEAEPNLPYMGSARALLTI